MLTHFSLFSGIGGLDLAAEWAGFVTVGQCEFADYPTKVLEKHWPNVPRWRDIRDVTMESFYRRTGLRTVDIISGGFPCQPFSVAGKQKGKEDDRYLWPEMLRVIREIKPTWVLGENVPGILSIAGKTVCEDLEREGYAVTVFNFEAAAVGAPHRRDRVFFVANSESEQNRRREQPRIQSDAGADGQNVADTDSEGIQRRENTGKERRERKKPVNEQFSRCNTLLGNYWATEPDVGGRIDGFSSWLDRNLILLIQSHKCVLNRWDDDWEKGIPRVANGIPHRVDRLKCLGNAVVPQQVYPIFKAIYDIEKGGRMDE